MADLVTVNSGAIIELLHKQGGELAIPKPFERDIFLFDSNVAGTSYIEGIEELEPHLNIGDRLQFLREPDNPYDKQAIVIRNKDGVKIGYVPRSDNVIFSRLMDAGKILFGEITEKKWKGKWLDMKIRIYLHE
ncbi:MAG: HIRAN domain-containing protein [Synergistes sp.]|nr:HIRAN domain-containing protein [Synergistes sp.]